MLPAWVLQSSRTIMLEILSAHGLARLLGCVALLAVLGGCSANQYATPRTVPAGKVVHTAAVEVFGIPDDDKLPNLRYQLRVGLADRVDLGVTAGPMVGADLKLNAVRTKRVDLAFDPGFEVGIMVAGSGDATDTFPPYIQGKFPLLLGFNLMKEASIYLHGGLAAMTFHRHLLYCTPYPCGEREVYASGMAGIGVQIRVADFVALQPEVSIIEPFREDTRTMFQAGLGISFGALPDFKELD
jgi:hypothetical protein